MNTAKKLSIRLEAVGGDKVRQEFKNIGSDGQKAFQRITQVITPANDNLKILDNTAKAFNNTLKQAASLAGAYLGLRGLTNTFKSIVETNKEFERLSGSLKTVTGSAKAAKEAFTLIEDFATSTPFQLDEIVDSFIRLKAMGLEPSMEALISYGNTASAFGKNILEFVSAVTSATVGEFERLKTFGIKAKVEGELVKFIFQGITTEVGKNAVEIENYLRSIGTINFGGAMAEQMNTMGGTMSNIEDALAKVARTIGENGLNKAIKEVLDQFNNLISGTDGAAKTIGETLASAVTIAGKAFFTLAKYIEPIITLLTVRLGASLITKGIDLLKASVYALNVALMGTGTAGASATLGLKMMWQVSKVAAVQMYATAVAAKVLAGAVGLLKGIMALLGGPAGLVMLVVYGLYKLIDSHNVAKRAANDHADTLAKLKEQMAETVKETNNLVTAQSKNQAIAEWSYKLKVAEKNIKDLKEELKDTGGLSFFQRHAPNMFLKEYQIFANDLADILSQSKYNLEEYQKEVWRLAAEYPDFQPQAKAIQEKFLLLKAAEIDAQKARDELDELKHHGTNDFDYQITKEPIHLIEELNIIATVLEKIRTNIASGKCEKAIIISDHGASRLAVINETENKYEMSEKGEHSGRCCPVSDIDEKPDFATEENGYWVLANYDRFKGGRKANVEVHGGAALEEVCVPIIEITPQNEKIDVRLLDSYKNITVSFRKSALIKFFINKKLNNLKVKIEGKYYDAQPTAEEFVYQVSMPDIRKAKNYIFDVYASENMIASGLQFNVKSEVTVEKDLF